MTATAPLDVVAAVAERFEVEMADVLGRGLEPPVAAARSAAYAVLRRTTTLSFPAIGRVMGRHHSTVLEVITHVEADPAALALVEEVAAALAAAPLPTAPPPPLVPGEDWRTAAGCAGTDPDFWHPEGDSPEAAAQTAAAKAICRTCPVREDCLEWALAAGRDVLGIAGGMTLAERRRSRRRSVGGGLATERRAIARRMRASGIDVPSIAATLGLSPKSVYRLLAQARAEAS